MALGTKLSYRAKDTDGDEYWCRLRHALKDEWAQYKKESMDFQMHGRKVDVSNDVAAVKVSFFDLIVEDVGGVYSNKDGQLVPFNITDKKIPPDEFERIKKQLGVDCSSVLDLIPYQFKVDAITACYDTFDEQVQILKKNLEVGSKPEGIQGKK